MSGRGGGWKRKGEGDCPSGDNSEGLAPPKKVAKAESSDEGDDIVVCEISNNRKVTVRNWNKKIWVDIREFYVKDGKQLPGKKGISLSLDQWAVLRDHADEIDKALSNS